MVVQGWLPAVLKGPANLSMKARNHFEEMRKQGVERSIPHENPNYFHRFPLLCTGSDVFLRIVIAGKLRARVDKRRMDRGCARTLSISSGRTTRTIRTKAFVGRLASRRQCR
jgi:hypothetical protein